MAVRNEYFTVEERFGQCETAATVERMEVLNDSFPAKTGVKLEGTAVPAAAGTSLYSQDYLTGRSATQLLTRKSKGVFHAGKQVTSEEMQTLLTRVVRSSSNFELESVADRHLWKVRERTSPIDADQHFVMAYSQRSPTTCDDGPKLQQGLKALTHLQRKVLVSFSPSARACRVI